MDASVQEIAEGLKRAVQTETDGHHFYLMASRSVSDEKGRQVFETLAREELMHLKFLQLQYRSFMERGEADASAKLGPKADLSGENPIFSGSLRSRIGEAHIEMSALSIGIQLELNAERYYRAQADATGDVAVHSFFLELAEWEAGHYRALLKQQESLKEDYWNAGGFAPF